jgi:hypothetical protein
MKRTNLHKKCEMVYNKTKSAITTLQMVEVWTNKKMKKRKMKN